jgi:hypothetical protein
MYGVIERADWTISPDLVTDCKQREGIEDYLAAAMSGNVGPSQREFVHRNGPSLFRVLKRIWPELGHCAAVPADGAVNSEKWGILKYSGLPESQLADLLRESLQSEGLGDEFTSFVLSHPIPALKGDVARELKSEESVSPTRNVDAVIQVYCLALLYSLGQKDVADKLDRLRADDQMTAAQKKVIASLLSKIKGGANITWADIEEINYESQL